MSFRVDTGAGVTAEISEPSRGAFANNLGGAVQFALANSLYKVMEIMGGGLGSFGAGIAVQFLERVEPSLVEYSRPLIDLILEQPGLPSHLRDFFTQLREPTHEGAAAILGGLSSQAASGMTANILAPLLQGMTQTAHRATRNTLMGVGEFLEASRRGVIDQNQLIYALAGYGYTDEEISWLQQVTQSRAGVSDLLTGLIRKNINTAQYEGAMMKFAFSNEDIALFKANARQLPGVGDLIQSWFRGELSAEEIREKLGKLGFVSADIELMLKTAPPIPGAPDLVRMGLREAFRDDIAAQWSYDEDFPPPLAEWMAKLGYAPDWAKFYWRAHWDLPSLSQGFEMFHRRVIDASTLSTLLRVSDIPAFWRDKLTKISYNPLTRVDVRRMYGLGVLDREQVYESYLDTGYSPANAEAMTQFTLLYENPDGTSKLDDYKELTRSVITQAFRKSVISRDQAVTRLMAIGYGQEDIEILLSIAEFQQQVADAPDYMQDYQKDVKSIIEKSYAQRVISESEAKSSLTGVGYSDTEADYILLAVDFWYNLDQTNEALKAIGDVYVSRGINRANALSRLGSLGIPSEMMAQKIAEWDTQRNIRSRRLTEAQYRKALQGDLIGADEYQENLRGLGYTEYDVWILTNLAVGTEVAGPRPSEGPLS